MKRLLLLPFVGLLLAAAPAMAQQSTDTSSDPTLVAQANAGRYVVYFDLGQAALDSEARATIAAAAQEFQTTGSARISVRGHTDTSGNADFNQALSERREQAVADELVSLGVPVTAITGEALGETDLAVPTGDGVPEAQNRRVEIAVEQPAPPPEPAPAPAPEPVPPVAAAPAPEPAMKRGLFSGGIFYGFNLEDEAGNTSHLGGINLGLDYAVLPFLSVGVEQAGFYHFDTRDDGFGGRSAGSIDFLMGDQDFQPHVGANVGYLYGDGFKDDGFAGPEIGFQAGLFNMKVAYDIPFNRDLDEGIVNTTIGVGFRF
ncbi:MAG TPA: OmpA family protein [Dongiaceae bacterium]|nr:OmpA family protein [Dongiaceae bacterium]